MHPPPKAVRDYFFSGSEDEDEPSSDERSEDIDPPRVAQWIDDDPQDLEGTDDDRSATDIEPVQKLQSLQDDLSTLPLGALRSAQRSLAQAQALSDTASDLSEDDSTSSDGDDHSLPRPSKINAKAPSKPKHATTNRANKHAPAEVTSKRPVSRRRVVVDDALPKPRDPRFTHATGRYDSSKFKQRYDFLPSLRRDELSVLRENMKRAQKFLANSPSHLRSEREEEVKRIERAVKTAESAVNLDNRERVESKALRSAKQMEKDKRQQGKADWWMKRSEKKALLAKARMDAVASAGGKRAVKKAVEKKQKKMSQKEKRMRPFSRNEGMGWSDGKKGRPESVDAGRGAKRRRVA